MFCVLLHFANTAGLECFEIKKENAVYKTEKFDAEQN